MIRAIALSLLLATSVSAQEFVAIGSPYDASAVAITGGTMDGVAIGGTTPGTGAFTSATLGGNVTLQGEAADVLALRDGTDPQSLRVYNTYTDGSNYERSLLGWSSNAFYVQTAGAGTGTQRGVVVDGASVYLRSGGTTKVTVGGTDTVFDQRIRAGTTATIDIGSTAFYWRDLYLSRLLRFSDGTEIVPNGDGGVIFRTAADSPRLTVDASGNLTPGGVLYRTVTAGITASTTQTQGQGPLTTWLNEVSTVANANDTVTLPTAVAGMEVVVCNNGANTLQIFPASGDNLGAGLNTATTLAAGSNVTYVSYDATNWEVK